MEERDSIAAARARIARRRGQLGGWRPMMVGDNVAVVALAVLGDANDHPGLVGMRVVVAGRDARAIEREGVRAAAYALHRRAVLGPDDDLVVEHSGPIHDGDAPRAAGLAALMPNAAEPHKDSEGWEAKGTAATGPDPDDPLAWPWQALTFHVPLASLPAIAGLTSDAVHEA